ncbi:hemerythrin domain-containing protein [Cryptosporangium phraense]|uniref:Hemerythrin domain-containing protein n=1 Tax=Cryptosporangium phraense TaxID=2593070 RepID=A0A545AI24_9ACTN|nr:hemerythrin domain-containing protein [Cryptosporangium phraense]TQS40969.1 hemerythrin domain-containing protein [Cryptosporangium phraense]
MTRPIDVRPRTAGEPVPDIIGMKLAHRVMLEDAARLTALAEALAAGRTRCDATRAKAVAAYVTDFADSVHHHHTAEDDILWPVIEASAGPHVDLTALTDDHSALDPRLDQLRAAAIRFAASPGEDTATVLAVGLAELRDLLDEHIADEEVSVFPVIEEYVSVANWKEVETRIQKRASLTFEAPRVVAAMTPEEYAALRAEAPLPIRIMIKLLVPRFAKRERLVFAG